MAFKRFGTLVDNVGPVLQKRIITNSVVTTEQDSVKVASGFSALGTTGALVFGHVTSIVDAEGLGMTTSGAAGAGLGSFAGTFTAAADNQTVAQVAVVCDVSKYTLYDGSPDAALGTTTGSNLAQYTMDLLDEDDLDESSAATTTGQYMSQGITPGSTTRIVVNIYESQVFGV
jgi:hypothetical protein